MKIRALRVAHIRKNANPCPGTLARLCDFLPGSFHLNTCQRKLWVYRADRRTDASAIAPELEVLAGSEAYRFLLRVACGLESQVMGETDVFGQLKQAWKSFEASLSDTRADGLAGWMQKLFEDTKEIRRLYLQNFGGSSYGTLARMLLKQKGIQPSDTILILGAGKIAHSVTPFLLENDLLIHNRSPEAARKLAESLPTRSERAPRILTDAELADAWQSARFALVCTPPGIAADPELIRNWRGKCVIHLGGMRLDCSHWSKVEGFQCLDDLFELQKFQGDARLSQFTRALRACDERALLRSLSSVAGGSVTLAHGWEDLAEFA